MNINVTEFFRRYSSSAELRDRVQQAEDMYPGSLEIREALVEAVLLPIARELGIPFTVEDLRQYENELKLHLRQENDPSNQDMRWDTEYDFWLLDRGWTSDEASFCNRE